jgi:hypothetical protein
LYWRRIVGYPQSDITAALHIELFGRFLIAQAITERLKSAMVDKSVAIQARLADLECNLCARKDNR